jgi:hypothetical protein
MALLRVSTFLCSFSFRKEKIGVKALHDVCRSLSTTTSNDDELGTPSIKVLYKANPAKAVFPRSLIAFTTVHTGYWSWYLLDFMPALKESALDPASVDFTVGYLGLGLSVFMAFGSMLYPRSLVSEISRNDADGTLEVKTFTLPFVLTSKSTKYQIGDLVFDSPNDVTKILTLHNGKICEYQGHLPLHAAGKFNNLLINIKENSGEEFVDNDTLLKSLIPGQTKSTLAESVDKSKFHKETAKKLNIKKKRGALLRRKLK